MVNETAKIIFNLLASGEKVFLDGVGTLSICCKPAKRISRRSIMPPYRFVAFEPQQHGTSITEHIAHIGGVDADKAHEIYGEWLSEATHDGVTEIAGAGRIENGRIFIMDSGFEKLLNPQGTSPVNTSPRLDAVLYLFVATCCIFALCIFGYIWYDGQKDSITRKLRTPAAHAHEAAATTSAHDSEDIAYASDTAAAAVEAVGAVEAVEAVAPVAAAGTDNATTEHNTTTAAEPAAAQPAREVATGTENSGNGDIPRGVSGRSYVVLGIYSTIDNARNAADKARGKFGYADMTIYRYADKFMVSAYESDSRNECAKYLAALKGDTKEMWIYTKK